MGLNRLTGAQGNSESVLELYDELTSQEPKNLNVNRELEKLKCFPDYTFPYNESNDEEIWANCIKIILLFLIKWKESTTNDILSDVKSNESGYNYFDIFKTENSLDDENKNNIRKFNLIITKLDTDLRKRKYLRKEKEKEKEKMKRLEIDKLRTVLLDFAKEHLEVGKFHEMRHFNDEYLIQKIISIVRDSPNNPNKLPTK